MAKPTAFNPYKIFQDWLFDGYKQSLFPSECLNSINKRAVLSSMGKLGGVTIVLNEIFNNYGLMSIPDLEFYQYIKEDIIQRYRVDRWGLSYFKSEKKDKSIKDLHLRLPHLKPHEIYMLLEIAKDDPDYTSFEESLGLRKSKKTKLTKKELKKIEEERMLSFDETPKKSKELKATTFGQLLKLYELEEIIIDNVAYQKI